MALSPIRSQFMAGPGPLRPAQPGPQIPAQAVLSAVAPQRGGGLPPEQDPRLAALRGMLG